MMRGPLNRGRLRNPTSVLPRIVDASWYCWYSDTRSFMLLSASVNSISSMPSPVYLVAESYNPFFANK